MIESTVLMMKRGNQVYMMHRILKALSHPSWETFKHICSHMPFQLLALIFNNSYLLQQLNNLKTPLTTSTWNPSHPLDVSLFSL